MPNNITLLILLSIAVCAVGQMITPEQMELLEPQITKMTEGLNVLEAELLLEQTKMSEAFQTLEETRKKLAQNPGLWERGKLKAQESYQEAIFSKYYNSVEEKSIRLLTIRCILFATKKENISREQLLEHKIWLPKIEQRLITTQEKYDQAEYRLYKAQKRLEEIPEENKLMQQTIDNLQKQLALLEYKKSWGNWLERTELNSKITAERGKLLKNDGEHFIQTKIQQDSLSEMASMKYENIEATVAITVLKNLD